jgi:hypothetical protein
MVKEEMPAMPETTVLRVQLELGVLPEQLAMLAIQVKQVMQEM